MHQCEKASYALATDNILNQHQEPAVYPRKSTYNLVFDVEQLQQQAKREDGYPLVVVGDCLMEHASKYFGVYRLSMADACRRIGAPMPDRPQQTALHRAQGQRALLRAMAAGVIAVPDAATADEEDYPF